MLEITIFIIVGVISIFLFLLFNSKTIWEKLMFLNLISIKLIMLISVFAVIMDVPEALDVSITYSIIGFISITLLSRFLLTGGRLK